MLKAVVFDFYGTLAETRDWGPSFADMVVEMGYDLPDDIRDRWWNDGIDGTEDDAGAIMTSDTMARARAAGLDAGAALADNDSHGFFAALGDLVTTGPTRTNVNDFRAILLI